MNRMQSGVRLGTLIFSGIADGATLSNPTGQHPVAELRGLPILDRPGRAGSGRRLRARLRFLRRKLDPGRRCRHREFPSPAAPPGTRNCPSQFLSHFLHSCLLCRRICRSPRMRKKSPLAMERGTGLAREPVLWRTPARQQPGVDRRICMPRLGSRRRQHPRPNQTRLPAIGAPLPSRSRRVRYQSAARRCHRAHGPHQRCLPAPLPAAQPVSLIPSHETRRNPQRFAE
jgi:hypothetical protein